MKGKLKKETGNLPKRNYNKKIEPEWKEITINGIKSLANKEGKFPKCMCKERKKKGTKITVSH